MSKTGRFETSTKTRIKTKFGTILRTARYSEDSFPEIEYTIRPICNYCKESIGCVCFNPDNSENPYEDALSTLEGAWTCGKVKCVLAYQKENDPEYYEIMKANYNGDEEALAEAFSEIMPELEDGDFCPC